jgi:hypothetical protein
MPYVLEATKVPDQELMYYAGSATKKEGRAADRVTPYPDHATEFETEEEAKAMVEQLGGTYTVKEQK